MNGTFIKIKKGWIEMGEPLRGELELFRIWWRKSSFDKKFWTGIATVFFWMAAFVVSQTPLRYGFPIAWVCFVIPFWVVSYQAERYAREEKRARQALELAQEILGIEKVRILGRAEKMFSFDFLIAYQDEGELHRAIVDTLSNKVLELTPVSRN